MQLFSTWLKLGGHHGDRTWYDYMIRSSSLISPSQTTVSRFPGFSYSFAGHICRSWTRQLWTELQILARSNYAKLEESRSVVFLTTATFLNISQQNNHQVFLEIFEFEWINRLYQKDKRNPKVEKERSARNMFFKDQSKINKLNLINLKTSWRVKESPSKKSRSWSRAVGAEPMVPPGFERSFDSTKSICCARFLEKIRNSLTDVALPFEALCDPEVSFCTIVVFVSAF